MEVYNVTFALQAINMLAAIPTPPSTTTNTVVGPRGLPSQQDDKIDAANDILQQEEDQFKDSQHFILPTYHHNIISPDRG